LVLLWFCFGFGFALALLSVSAYSLDFAESNISTAAGFRFSSDCLNLSCIENESHCYCPKNGTCCCGNPAAAWFRDDFASSMNQLFSENDNHFCAYAIIFTQCNFCFIICLCRGFVNGYPK